LPVGWHGDDSLDAKRSSDARQPPQLLGAVNQNLLNWWLIVGDALERNVRHDPADLFALAVLLAPIDKAARWAGAVLQLIVGVSGRQQPLASKRQGHAAGVDGDPAPPPLLGHIGGRAAAARWV